MTINFETHRFGPDEGAVGRLINGDLPDDDDERWSMLDAARFRIERLLDDHQRAQAALRRYQDSGAPFVLYLRSFGAEASVHREGQAFGTTMNLSSLRFQTAVQQQLHAESASFVRLHGGSDSLLTKMVPQEVTEARFEPGVLATNGGNWNAVATELIRDAPAILFLVTEFSAGVAEEFELIREAGREDRTLVVVVSAERISNPEPDVDFQSRLAGFPHIFTLSAVTAGPPRALMELLNTLLGTRSEDPPAIDLAISMTFSYVEQSFVESDDFSVARSTIWGGLRSLRVVLADDYWAALKARGMSYRDVQLTRPWMLAHKIYGLAVVTADFPAMREAARMLFLLWIQRGADLAFAVATLDAKLGKLEALIHRDGSPDTEAATCPSPDPLSFPATVATALDVFEQASWAAQNKRFAVALARELAEEEPTLYGRDLDVALNNLGALLLRQGEHHWAEAALVEALDRRRRRTSDDDEDRVDLYHSLANLGLLWMERESYDAAAALFEEAIAVCERRLPEQPLAIVDQSRVEVWMSKCLAESGDASGLHQYVRGLQERREDLARIDEKVAADLDQILVDVIRGTNASGHDDGD